MREQIFVDGITNNYIYFNHATNLHENTSFDMVPDMSLCACICSPNDLGKI